VTTTAASDLSSLERAVLLLLLAPHVEPRYRTLYGVLQDALSECWPTERLLLTVLGRTPERRGPVVLFSGRSATGKTLAAEILVGGLRRPSHVVDACLLHRLERKRLQGVGVRRQLAQPVGRVPERREPAARPLPPPSAHTDDYSPRCPRRKAARRRADPGRP